jgi:hypothetical protein
MRRDDARKLEHATLEAMRERAVQRVQEGECLESASALIRYRANLPVARRLSARRLGRAEGEAAFWEAAKAGWQVAAVVL